MTDSEDFADVDGSFFFGSQPKDFAQLAFSDQNARFRAITINNQSSRLCSVYLDATGSGTPAFTVLPGTFVTQPVASAQYVSLRFFAQKGGVDAGAIYVHGCNMVLSASSGIASAASASGVVFDYSQFDVGAFSL